MDGSPAATSAIDGEIAAAARQVEAAKESLTAAQRRYEKLVAFKELLQDSELAPLAGQFVAERPELFRGPAKSSPPIDMDRKESRYTYATKLRDGSVVVRHYRSWRPIKPNTTAAKLFVWFRENGNRPITIYQAAEVTGAGLPSCRQVLFVSHYDYFLKSQEPDSPRKRFCLLDEVWANPAITVGWEGGISAKS